MSSHCALNAAISLLENDYGIKSGALYWDIFN